MKTRMAASLAVIIVHMVTPGSARAEERGIEMGVRSGYALGFGDTFWNGRIPLWFEAGYRHDPRFYLGAFLQYGILFFDKSSTSVCGYARASSCSGDDLTVGVDGHYHFHSDGPIEPWIGLAVGYEWAHEHLTGGIAGDTSFSTDGWALFNLQVGGDYKASPSIRLGAFGAVGVGHYANSSATAGNTSSSSSSGGSLHEWLTFGMRGAYDLYL
jgi:hypothetical protein